MSRASWLAVRNAIFATLVLAACAEGRLVEGAAVDSVGSDSLGTDTLVIDTLVPDVPPADTGLTLRVNGRTIVWSGSDTAVRITYGVGLHAGLLDVYAFRGTGDSMEAVQVTLFGFHGAGGYPLFYNDPVNGGVGIYAVGRSGWWSDEGPADSVWVTAFDSASGRVEGTFRFIGHRSPTDSVVVDSGHFRGIAKEYVPPPPPDCVSDSLVGDCHVYSPAPCWDTVNPPTADTVVGAFVNGNPWVMSSAWNNQWSAMETRVQHPYLTIGGALRSAHPGAPGERLQVWIYGFHGPGVYPMTRTPTEGRSYGYYQCESKEGPSDADAFVPLGWVGDEVVVSSWDPVTGEIAGTFQFRASEYGGSGAGVQVTNGTFHLNIPIR